MSRIAFGCLCAHPAFMEIYMNRDMSLDLMSLIEFSKRMYYQMVGWEGVLPERPGFGGISVNHISMSGILISSMSIEQNSIHYTRT